MEQPLPVTHCGKTEFHWGNKTYVMGIINVTPDSFSGDGLGFNIDTAVRLARSMVASGADIIDVGGESIRPGSNPISTEEEIQRVIPVIERLAKEITVPISIDSYKSEVAARALAAGATILNDVWGLKHDPEIARLAARFDLPLVLMHNQVGTEYIDLVPDVIESLRGSVNTALSYGVRKENIIIDPGIGFGKTMEHNLEVLKRLAEFKQLGQPILLGTSRKSTIGRILNLPPDQRVEGTAATVAIGIAFGADIVRVHDVEEMVRVCKVSDAIIRGKW